MPRASPSALRQITPAAFLTPALACLLLVLAAGIAEIAARTTALRAALGAPSVGSPSRQFEQQLDSLDRYAASTQRLDCVVLGNSTTLMGVDPDALSRAYRERLGQGLRCFNFGVAGMTASAAGAVAPILVERHRPWLLIYEVSVRDLGQSVDGPLLANTPWVQYRQGTFSLAGWLTEYSAAFRGYLLYRQWFDPVRWRIASRPAGTTSAGFMRFDPGLSLSPALWRHTQRTYAEIVGAPVSEAELLGFSRVLDLTRRGTQVVVVEAPVHETLRRWSQHTTTFGATATAHIRQAARQRRAPFWRVAGWRVIPADGWADFVHLNPRGAAQFSEWLGARIAAAVQEGRLKAPHATPTQG